MNAERQPSVLKKRLAELMLQKKWGIHTLAKKSGISVGTIQNLVTNPFYNPTVATLEAVCHGLGVSLTDVLQKEGTLYREEKEGTLYSEGHVPLLVWPSIELWLHNPSTKNRHLFSSIPTSCAVSSQSFALSVSDHSFMPLFPKETILIFDPEKPYAHYRYVLIKFMPSSAIVLKQLIFDNSHYYIQFIHPELKKNLTLLTEDAHILATLVQAQVQY